MHEMSITESILDVAFEEAKKYDARKIKSITLRIGRLRRIIPETLRFCFEVMSRETIGEGAELRIEEIPIRAHCAECNQDFNVEDFFFLCPECGTTQVRMLQGDELILANMELE